MVTPHLHFQGARTWTVRADLPVPDGVGSMFGASGRITEPWNAEGGRGERSPGDASW
jgi:hypothetical protein